MNRYISNATSASDVSPYPVEYPVPGGWSTHTPWALVVQLNGLVVVTLPSSLIVHGPFSPRSARREEQPGPPVSLLDARA